MIRSLSRISNISENAFVSHRCLSTIQPAKHYDIIVAGGGMVGTTLACTLGKNPILSEKSIMLLESSPPKPWNLSQKYGNRVSALNKTSFDLLNKIGAWEHITQARFAPVKRMQVWEGLHNSAITFESDKCDEPVAYIVENDLLCYAVLKEINELNNVDMKFKAKIKTCKSEDDEGIVTICMESGETLTCNLLLGCDGVNSLVRQQMGMHWVTLNCEKMGLVATLKIAEDSDNSVAWQRHLPDGGFLAILPLSKGLSSMVWTTEAEHAKRLSRISENEFIDSINEVLFKIYPDNELISQVSKSFDNLIRCLNLSSTFEMEEPPKILSCEDKSRAVFPLGIGHATNYIGKGVALVGDAAHRVLPITGQGVNLGFGDVVCLNEVLEEAIYNGSNIDNFLYLKGYETKRQRYNVSIMLGTHGLYCLNSIQFPPLVVLRNLGLQATHAITPLKKFFISQAAGQPFSAVK